jgi:hypothetical protein
MSSGAALLAVWLTPVVWLAMPALIVERGPHGLWMALALALVPLVALGGRAPAPAAAGSDPVFPVVILLCTAAVLIWANLVVAGDVAAWIGEPRWHGIAAAAAGGWLLTAWRGSRRAVSALLLVAILAVGVPLGALMRSVGLSPLAAWARVATQTAFRFPATSPWVGAGRDSGLVVERRPILFEEEHRVTAPAGARISVRTRDGDRVTDVEWMLSPGQSVVLRPGDLLRAGSSGRLRFEPDTRVPGSPPSGIAWAEGGAPDWPRRAGLLVTVLFGAIALCSPVAPAATSRTAVALAAGGALVALLWAQAWAVYCVLVSPDLFLGDLGPARLAIFPVVPGGGALRPVLQASMLAGGLVGFLASSVALRERLGALDRTGGGEIGRDLGLWAGVFAIAGLASLWSFDAWFLTLLAMGAVASGLGPAAFARSSAPSPGADAMAGVAGLLTFAVVALAGQLRGVPAGPLGALFAYPALAAVPAGAIALRLARVAGRTGPSGRGAKRRR